MNSNAEVLQMTASNINQARRLLPMLLLALSFSATAQAAKSIPDTSLGLTKTDVNDSPAPEKFTYSEDFPGIDPVLKRAYPGAPPQIPHLIEAFLPVGKARNMCKVCHDKRDTLGANGKAKKVKGQPTAIPASHYTDHRLDTGKIGKTVVGARTVCTQCHVPQANIKPLVENTFDD